MIKLISEPVALLWIAAANPSAHDELFRLPTDPLELKGRGAQFHQFISHMLDD